MKEEVLSTQLKKMKYGTNSSIGTTHHIPLAKGSIASPSAEVASAICDTDDSKITCTARIYDRLKRVEVMLKQQHAHQKLVRDVSTLSEDLSTTIGNISKSLAELGDFSHRLEEYVELGCQTDSLNDFMYPMARAVMNWEWNFDDLVSASNKIVESASLTNIEMTILEQEYGAQDNEGWGDPFLGSSHECAPTAPPHKENNNG